MPGISTKQNDRIRKFAKQRGINTVGQFKNNTTKGAVIAKLTPAQQRRLRRKG